jgi:hypothetical protein
MRERARGTKRRFISPLVVCQGTSDRIWRLYPMSFAGYQISIAKGQRSRLDRVLDAVTARFRPQTSIDSQLEIPLWRMVERKDEPRERIFMNLADAYLCCNCETLGNSANQCPRCESSALMLLTAVIPSLGVCSGSVH